MTQAKQPPLIASEEEQRVVALKAAMRDHGHYLFRHLLKYTKQYQDAENLTQTLWLHAYQKFPVDKIGHLPWLRRKAYQLFIDYYRRRRHREQTPLDDAPTPAIGFYREAEDEVEEAALFERFWENFEALSFTKEEKECLWHYERYGYTYQELANRYNCGLSTIRDRLNRMKTRMADYLQQLEDEGANPND